MSLAATLQPLAAPRPKFPGNSEISEKMCLCPPIEWERYLCHCLPRPPKNIRC
jgi:hypothetical protein